MSLGRAPWVPIAPSLHTVSDPLIFRRGDKTRRSRLRLWVGCLLFFVCWIVDCGLGRGLVTLLVYQLVNLLVTFWFTCWFFHALIRLMFARILAVRWTASTGSVCAHLNPERLRLLA